MTTATAHPLPAQADLRSTPRPRSLGQYDFLLHRLHSLTGIVFGGYIVVHLLVNASLVQGTNPDVYQVQVDKIHSLPFLPLIEWAFIYLPILFHTVYGICIIATGQPNVDKYGYGKNWAYVGQRVSAIILVAFILFHVLGMKGLVPGFGGRLTFNEHLATQTTVNHLHAQWWVGYIVYPIGILAATYHLANGFWTAGISWGLTVSKQSQRRWGFACAALFLFTFGCGMTALISALATPARPVDQSHYVPSKATLTAVSPN